MGKDRGLTMTLTRSLPEGVAIRKYKSGRESIMIRFTYQGVECREYFKLKPNTNNITWAMRQRAIILDKIERGTFKYNDFFPYSKRAVIFGHVNDNVLIENLLDDYLIRAEKQLEYSTYRDYVKSIKLHLKPAFGKIPVNKLNSLVLREWVDKHSNLTSKRIRNVLIPLRHILDQAKNDGFIKDSPLDNIVVHKLLPRKNLIKPEIRPFDENEMKLILSNTKGQFHNLLLFAFFTGLRTSELLAIQWNNVNFKKGVINIKNAIVLGKTKGPKTKSGKREIILLPPAIEALENQIRFTKSLGKYIFLNPTNSLPWTDSKQIYRRWNALFKKIGHLVEYRKPYNTRHTYASMLLSRGENEWFIANQLGHANTEMIHRHYGKWIQDKSERTGYKFKADWNIDFK